MKTSRSPILISIASVILALTLAYGVYASLSFALGTRFPIGYVVGNSMLPTLQPGDLIVIEGVEPGEVRVGDIIVFQPPGRVEPIVHRVIEVRRVRDEVYVTTKGDNNPISLPEEVNFSARYIVGKVVYRIPYLGWFVYWLQIPVASISGLGEVKLGFLLVVGFTVLYLIQEYLRYRKSKLEEKREPEEPQLTGDQTGSIG